MPCGHINSGQLSASACDSRTASSQKRGSFGECGSFPVCVLFVSLMDTGPRYCTPQVQNVLHFHLCLPAYQLHFDLHQEGHLVWSNVLSKTPSASALQLLWCSPCRYSYGKAVQGIMRVTLCQKARRRPQNASKDVCREYSGPVSKVLEDTWVVEEHHTGQCVKG